MLVLLTRGMAFDFSCHVSSYFNPNPNKLNEKSVIKNTCPVTQEHLHAARLCHLVYDDEYLYNSERFVDSPSTDVQCSMSVDDCKLYVVFRGSDDSTDWSHNFDMNLVSYPSKSNKQVHTGFLVQWLSVREEVTTKIAEMIDLSHESGTPIQTVVFTGHSAGSPPACLCALESLENIEVRVVTFGSPRFSNQAFKDYFEALPGIQKCTRFVLDRDLVTRFPINFFNGYRHVGSPLQLRDGRILERDTTNFETFQWFVLGLPRFDFGVRDHDISNYVKKIESCVNRHV